MNLLGQRDREIYGCDTVEDMLKLVRRDCKNVKFDYFQSNLEGEIIDRIQSIGRDRSVIGVIINPGAYAHYSYAIADALADLPEGVKKVEVHISNIHSREDFRSKSVTARNVDSIISGMGITGYLYAALYIADITAKVDLPF